MIKNIVRKTIGWDNLSWERKSLIRYKMGYLAAVILSLFPFSSPRLFALFGSDKDEVGGHSYGETYDRIFRKFKYKKIKLLEIGIGGYDQKLGGNSLLAWRAYFMRGKIIGCDIVDKTILRIGNIKIKILDQSDANNLQKLIHEEKLFDMIIDDGSHLSRHQIATFNVLFEAVKEGGYYVIEDVQTSYWPATVADIAWDGAHVEDPEFADTCVGYFSKLAAYLNHAEFLDGSSISLDFVRIAKKIRSIAFEHNLIILEKGRNDSKSNLLPVSLMYSNIA